MDPKRKNVVLVVVAAAALSCAAWYSLRGDEAAVDVVVSGSQAVRSLVGNEESARPQRPHTLQPGEASSAPQPGLIELTPVDEKPRPRHSLPGGPRKPKKLAVSPVA